MKNPITVEITVNAPPAKVWEYWNSVEHIPGWAFAAPDWGAKPVSNEVRVGGAFKTHMFAKDDSAAFDFEGTYTAVQEHELLEFKMSDGRQVQVEFTQTPEGVRIVETFEAEDQNPHDMQRSGWQAFLDNFKKYTEAN